MVNKITTPPTQNEVIDKINELVDDKQDKITSSNKLSASLVSGLSTVATSGSYDDLSNKPTIPTVNNATLTIQKNGSNVATFTANASSNVTANISVPTVTSTYTATGTDAVNGVAVSNAIATKQDNLVSGTNIKTINGNSLLGSGNITIETSSTPNVDGETISYNSSDALQTIAVKNVRDNSTLPIWHGTEYQWNHGDPTTWYYWQTSVSAMWSLCANVTGIGVPRTTIFENNRFIVCAYQFDMQATVSYIAYSTDNGETWQSSALPSSTMWSMPFYHNGVFSMIGSNEIAYSTDNCETWQSSSLPTGISYIARCEIPTYGNGRILAVCLGVDTYTSTRVFTLYSTDNGITWQRGGNIPSGDYISNVAYGNGRFVTISAGYCRYSTDNGETWKNGGGYFNDGTYYIIYVENDKFIAFNVYAGIKYTTDGGLTWNTAYRGGLEYPIPAIGNNIYAVLPSSSSSRGVLRSLDKGETWEEIGNTSLGAQISYGNDTFMIVGGSTDTYYSTDNCLTWTKAVSQSIFRGNAAYGNGRFIGGGTRVPDSSPAQYYMNTFTITYDKCYTDTANPTTTSVVYSEPEIVSSYTISSVTSGAITLSNNNTYYYNQSGNAYTYQTIGDAHPEYLCFIDGVGVKIGNTTIATNNSNS